MYTHVVTYFLVDPVFELGCIQTAMRYCLEVAVVFWTVTNLTLATPSTILPVIRDVSQTAKDQVHKTPSMGRCTIVQEDMEVASFFMVEML